MSKGKILLVDDDSDIMEAMRLPLEANSYEVFEATSGQEALGKIKEVKPDLIILDVMMETDTEGFHVSYKLRTDPEYAEYYKTPILMLTAIGKIKGMRFSPETDGDFLPVEEYVEKPIRPKDLLEKVAELLGE